jgi:two-component system OmpR family response regulator
MAKDQLILIVDDDANLREIVRFALEKEGFASVQAADGKQALAAFAEQKPTLVILDIMMPEMDGTEVCRQIRKTSELPIIFLSSKDDELDRILGLELGGDDYITKPFSPRELAARVKAIVRRAAARAAPAEAPAAASAGSAAAPASSAVADDSMRHGALRLDLTTYKGYWQEREVVLTAMEFGLLKALMSHPRKVFTRDELMTRAYDDNTVVSDRTIDSHVRRIRRKFSAVGLDPIETVTGFGYKMASAR